MKFPFPDSVTLEFARNWLRARSKKGEECPLCRQFSKVYRRKINSGMARWMIAFYRSGAHDGGFHDAWACRSRKESSHDWSLLAHWGLISSNPRKAKHWQITPRGLAYAENRLNVESHAVIYAARLIRLEGSPTSIKQSLGRHFNYQELMAQRPFSLEPQ